MTILGLAESFKTMNRSGLTMTLFDGLFLGKRRAISTRSLFKYPICAMKLIWKLLENCLKNY